MRVSMGRKPERVPTFLSFDVEPDGFQDRATDDGAWQGFVDMLDVVAGLRTAIRARTDEPVRFGWYLRMDPQVEDVFGRADWVGHRFDEAFDALSAEGDVFGVHAHAVRRDGDGGAWLHDFEDPAVLRAGLDSSLAAFQAWSGERCNRFRAGAGFVSNDLVARLDEHGVAVDLSLEPAKSWEGDVLSGVDRTPTLGRHVDCRQAGREVFRPAREDFRRTGGCGGRDLVMVPLMTTTLMPEKPWWWRSARRLARRGAVRARMLYPCNPWPSPRFFWDLVSAQLQTMERPYVSLAFRTDHPESARAERVRALLGQLPSHPLAERLVFADPVEAAPRLAR